MSKRESVRGNIYSYGELGYIGRGSIEVDSKILVKRGVWSI